jgi:hypothetical protein
MGMVIGHNVHDGLAAGDIDTILKVYGYGHGPVLLDVLIEVLGVGDEGGVTTTIAGDRRLARSVSMAIAARSIPVNAKTAPILIRLNELSIEVERRAAADIALNAPIRATIEPWHATASARGGGDRPMVPAVSPLDIAPEVGPGPVLAGIADPTGTTEVPAEVDPRYCGTSMRRTA